MSDAAAVALVTAALPALGERDRTALALAGVTGTPRPRVAERLGIDEAELAESLARARKELRRTLASLPGSGWGVPARGAPVVCRPGAPRPTPELAAIEPAAPSPLPVTRQAAPARRSPSELAHAVGWNVLLVVAIVLVLAALALTLTGALF